MKNSKYSVSEQNKDRVWTVRSEPWECCGTLVVMIESGGKSDSYAVDGLDLVLEGNYTTSEIEALKSENKRLRNDLKNVQDLLQATVSHIHLVYLEMKTNKNPCLSCIKKGENCKECGGFIYANTKEIEVALNKSCVEEH